MAPPVLVLIITHGVSQTSCSEYDGTPSNPGWPVALCMLQTGRTKIHSTAGSPVGRAVLLGQAESVRFGQ